MSDLLKLLKPCPFCAEESVLIDRPDGPLLVGAYVVCDHCNISTPIMPTAAEAIAAWNLRPASAEASAITRGSGPVAWWRWSYVDEQGNADADVQIGANKPSANVLPDNGFAWEPLYGMPLATPPAAPPAGISPAPMAGLPPLPIACRYMSNEPVERFGGTVTAYFTAEQMHDYARAALSQDDVSGEGEGA